ncbi:chemotaxis protein CheW [Blastochloris viridis]|uniref:Coupling protein CheW n=1 Tax=Blastochloris viridis TaxID=1079 RepID=A0A0H5BBF4_BLAVI|nr:chemotaxis protein CheW [Blastochloris viridis]ALK08302.1 Chemotaxis protein CheW [Blastochloris viridis]BAR98429.1 positive regulator of CheA protein activity, CheW [Blastochloris viridis]CUU44224.1 Coupling protein CheW [Blastochloris viridis]
MTKLRSDALEVLTLSLDGHAFAVPACYVREILDVVPVTEVPGANPFVSGLINVRGRVVPFADLRHKFGMPIAPSTIDTRIVVIEVDVDGDPTMIGIIAEKVHEVTEIAAVAIEETPRIGLTWRRDYIDCIAKRNGDFVVVLDIEAVFASHRRPRREFGADGSSGRSAA